MVLDHSQGTHCGLALQHEFTDRKGGQLFNECQTYLPLISRSAWNQSSSAWPSWNPRCS